jgi:hypothetical protein
VLVIRQQWVVRPKHRTDIGGVMDGGVEVGVITNRRGQQHPAIRLAMKRPLHRASLEHLTPEPTELQPLTARQGTIAIQRLAGQPITGIEDLVADSYADAGLLAVGFKDPHGQVLNRKVAARYVG